MEGQRSVSCKRGVAHLAALLLVVGLFLPSFGQAQATSSAGVPRTWVGHVDGLTTFVTVVPHGHTIPANVAAHKPWWDWGNTTSDAYLVAFSSPSNVRLILSFDRQSNGLPEARLYLNDMGKMAIGYSLTGDQLRVASQGGHPYLTIRALDGSWLLDRVANYNLSIAVDGPSGLGPSDLQVRAHRRRAIKRRRGRTGRATAHHPTRAPSATLIPSTYTPTDGQIDSVITVGSKRAGLPQWETDRLLLDPRPSWGYTRFEAMKRLPHAPPFRVARPFMPTFPYLGVGSGSINWLAENPNPLVYVPRQGGFQLNHFVGFEDGGIYKINSYAPPPLVNFESPFVFSNFDPSTRYAQMVVRSLSFPAGDPTGPSPYTDTRSTFRMSWKTTRSDLWEYGIDVAGLIPDAFTVRIGNASFRGVPPNDAAGWVASHRWPFVTFVQAMQGYPGSEGLYAYSAQNGKPWPWLSGKSTSPPDFLSHPWVQQKASDPSVDSAALPLGFRGEYSTNYFRRPALYVSPIDDRLHLLYSQGGVWNLGNCWVLRLGNLTGGPYLDAWSLQRLHSGPGCNPGRGHHMRPGQALYALDGYMLYAGPGGIDVRHSSYSAATFQIAPPTNKKSWKAFVRRVRRYQEGRNPWHLSRWLSPFPGPALRLAGTRLLSVHATSGGFHLVITVTRRTVDGRARSTRGLIRAGFPSFRRPGTYLLTYHQSGRRWSVALATPPRLRIAIHAGSRVSAYLPDRLTLSIHNMGSRDWRQPLTLSADGQQLYSGSPWVDGRETLHITVNWSPARAGVIPFMLTTRAHTLWRHSILASATPRTPPVLSMQVSIPLPWTYPGVVAILLAALYLLWQLWRRIGVA